MTDSLGQVPVHTYCMENQRKGFGEGQSRHEPVDLKHVTSGRKIKREKSGITEVCWEYTTFKYSDILWIEQVPVSTVQGFSRLVSLVTKNIF